MTATRSRGKCQVSGESSSLRAQRLIDRNKNLIVKSNEKKKKDSKRHRASLLELGKRVKRGELDYSKLPKKFQVKKEDVGCGKCRMQGCRSCRGFVLADLYEYLSDAGLLSDVLPLPMEEEEQGDVMEIDDCKHRTPKQQNDAGVKQNESPSVLEQATFPDDSNPASQGSGEVTPVKAAQPVDEHAGKSTPQMQDTLWWNPRDENVVREVKSCLQVSFAETNSIPSCRERQVEEISSWLNSCVKSCQGNALYLSGVPGTGKTLAASAIVRSTVLGLAESDSNLAPPVAMSINCMRLKTAKDVLQRIIEGFKTAALKTVSGQLDDDPIIQIPEDHDGTVLAGSWGSLSQQEHLEKIARAPILTKHEIDTTFTKRRRSSITESDLVNQTGLIFLILDEIDGMLEGRYCEEIMGSLLSLAASQGSRLIIIGISNSIDLVQRLVRPGAILHRYNMKPKNVVFPTYLREQVSRLIQERLASLPGPVFDNRAIEFCSRKIANGSGDMRRALEAASLAVDFAVKDVVDLPGEEAHGIGSETNRCLIGMKQMAKSLSKISGGIGASNEHVKAIRKLPVPQQLIMCTVSAMVGENTHARGLKTKTNSSETTAPLMGMQWSQPIVSLPVYRNIQGESKSSKAITLAEIEQGHRQLCSKVGVEKYSPSEFATAIEVLSTLGLIQLAKTSKSTDLKRSKVQLKIAEDDVSIALSEIPILKDILSKKQ